MSTDITVLTTFHRDGMRKYGQRFIDSFAANVDKKIKLLVYAEKCQPTNPDSQQIEIIDVDASLPKLTAFKERWKDDPKANGIPPDEIKRKRKDWQKEFKWDAVRFSHKVYAVFDACERINKDWVVWIDADTYFHSPWTYDEFNNLLPNRNWLTFVGRGMDRRTWPECGFYGMNMNSVICREFLKEFERYYNEAEKGIFKLPEWHDSYVFGHLLKKYQRYHPNVTDYTSNLKMKEARSGGGGHPLINTELGKWIDHLKGGRKELGKSKPGDLLIQRDEEYWNK